MEQERPAGVYEITTTEETIGDFVYEYRRVSTTIYLPPPSGDYGMGTFIKTNPAELENNRRGENRMTDFHYQDPANSTVERVKMVTADDVAKWMVQQIHDKRFLYQEEVVHKISRKFGESFTHVKPNGNLAISRIVLRAFKQVSRNSVVWERGERMWRARTDHDSRSRQQD
jgi:hypothetical protein